MHVAWESHIQAVCQAENGAPGCHCLTCLDSCWSRNWTGSSVQAFSLESETCGGGAPPQPLLPPSQESALPAHKTSSSFDCLSVLHLHKATRVTDQQPCISKQHEWPATSKGPCEHIAFSDE